VQLSSHDFIDFCLLTTPTISEVLRSRSTYWIDLIIQTCTLDVDTEEMLVSHQTLSPKSISTSADHPQWWWLHGSARNFTLTGTNFLSIPSHFAHTRSSTS